ncbi:MAG: glutathione S-transferase family protein [Robiginitomaculum sp.]|nr:glutathione S-transferase family protein [Robiginitomaculum sp.]
MIKLFQPPPAFNAANASPFCIKLEVLLKMAKLPYQITIEGDPSKGPTRKIPFVELDGKLIGDSGLIQNLLESKHGADFHENLSDEQKAISLAFTRLIEEHLYWVLVYSRWMEDENWQVIKSAFFGQLPIPLRWLLPNIIKKQVLKNMVGHGIARHDRSAIYQMAGENLTAIASFLGDKTYAFGDQASALDATLYGLLSSIIDADMNSELKTAALYHDNLVNYTSRMREEFFPKL